MSFKRRYEKRVKKADRNRRKIYYRYRNYIRSLGLGEIYFYIGWNDVYMFSYKNDVGAEITNKNELKKVIFGNHEIKNWDTGRLYENFEEYRKELLIIKMLGLK